VSYGGIRSKGRPISIHTRQKRTEQLYQETLQDVVFMKKPGETIADVISRIVKIYKSRTEETECYKLWREACSKVELLEEENRKQENRLIELEEENKKLKQVTIEYMSTQITKGTPTTLEQSSI
jgi:hypothetical protein